MCVHAKKKEISQQTSKETKGRKNHAKDKQGKDAKQGHTNMLSTRKGKQTYDQTKEGVLGGQM